MKTTIYSHRGYWHYNKFQNTLNSFKLSWKKNYSIETDLRDHNSKIVLAHDFPSKNSINLDVFLENYKIYGKNSFIAFNIKSDGMDNILRNKIREYKIKNYFLFDMSNCEAIRFIKKKMRIATRLSEYEKINNYLYKYSKFIWIDCFKRMWFNKNIIRKLISDNKTPIFVSPELHRRAHSKFWKTLKEYHIKDLHICTDFPDDAYSFFHD